MPIQYRGIFQSIVISWTDPSGQGLIASSESSMPRFQPKTFEVSGTSFTEFSTKLAAILPTVLRETDSYFQAFPTSRSLAEYIRFEYCLSSSRVDVHLAGRELCFTSGKFAVLLPEFLAHFSSEVQRLHSEHENQLFDDCEQKTEAAFCQAIEELAEDPTLKTFVLDRGLVLKLKVGDSRCLPWEIFPYREER